MGKGTALKILQQDNMAITEVFENKDYPYLDMDYGHIIGIDEWGIKVQTLSKKNKYKMGLLIDFSSPYGFRKAIKFAYENNLKFVSGTTGLKEKDFLLMEEYSKKIPIVYSSNMSTGINNILLMLDSIKEILSDNNRDIEIIEYHHNQKKDAPSGTAYLLANKIKSISNRDIDISNKNTFPRDNKIRIHAIRAGDIPGIHTIFISGQGETIEIKHSASSREPFFNGVIKSINFLENKNKGLFNMIDILKENK